MVNRRENDHPHLELRREEPAPRRRPRGGRSRTETPDDPAAHGASLRARLQVAREAATRDLGGYDERHLIKIHLSERISPEQVSRASSGMDIVSQEEDTLVLAFASATQLEAFEAKLNDLSNGLPVTYSNVRRLRDAGL